MHPCRAPGGQIGQKILIRITADLICLLRQKRLADLLAPGAFGPALSGGKALPMRGGIFQLPARGITQSIRLRLRRWQVEPRRNAHRFDMPRAAQIRFQNRQRRDDGRVDADPIHPRMIGIGLPAVAPHLDRIMHVIVPIIHQRLGVGFDL